MTCVPNPSRAWNRRASWLSRSAVAGCVSLASVAATAQALISPVVIEFGPKQKIATLRVSLSEKAIKPMRLQAQLLRWRQDLHGAAVTQPSEELIVTPRIAELQPGQQQVWRIALRGSLPAEIERAYRLVLEDVAQPSSVDLQGGAAVNFRMAYDLPVMVAPRGPVVTALNWRSCPASTAPSVSRSLCLRIVNAGNRRVKVQAITLSGNGWQQTLRLPQAEALLAGDEREWRIPADATGDLQNVQVRTIGGELLNTTAGG
jgi:fimbrial chaperone protein